MNPRTLVRDWRVKGLLQGVLSLIPSGTAINDRLQSGVGGLKKLEDNIRIKLDDWSLMMDYLRAAGVDSIEGWDILEIGAGWYPVFPVCFALAGAGSICAVDLNRHLNESMTRAMVVALEGHLDRIAAQAGCSLDSVRTRWRSFAGSAGLPALLAAAHIDYHAPADASKLHWVKDGALHLIYSNSVFEHIPPAVIPRLFQESRRVLSDDGLMVHEVACNDHYANFDRNICFVNYLRYPAWQWRFWNNKLQYQNRLRASEFIRMAEENGFRIIKDSRYVDPISREALERMQVAPEFRKFSPDELATTTVDFIAAKSLS